MKGARRDGNTVESRGFDGRRDVGAERSRAPRWDGMRVDVGWFGVHRSWRYDSNVQLPTALSAKLERGESLLSRSCRQSTRSLSLLLHRVPTYDSTCPFDDVEPAGNGDGAAQRFHTRMGSRKSTFFADGLVEEGGAFSRHCSEIPTARAGGSDRGAVRKSRRIRCVVSGLDSDFVRVVGTRFWSRVAGWNGADTRSPSVAPERFVVDRDIC